jgi:hypothetical protein
MSFTYYRRDDQVNEYEGSEEGNREKFTLQERVILVWSSSTICQFIVFNDGLKCTWPHCLDVLLYCEVIIFQYFLKLTLCKMTKSCIFPATNQHMTPKYFYTFKCTWTMIIRPLSNCILPVSLFLM